MRVDYTDDEILHMSGEEFAGIVEDWMERNNASYTTIADALGVTRRAISFWRSGQKPGNAKLVLMGMAYLEDHPEMIDAVRPCRWPHKAVA